MAVRTDVTIDYTVSPRIITVDSPSVLITIQDIHDTVASIEADLDTGMQFTQVIASAGKEFIDTGELVGVTATLQDAKLAFEDRAGPSFIQCKVSGGNLVAVDDMDVPIDPIQTTDFTQVVYRGSTSPTILETGVSGLTAPESAKLTLIEQLLRNKLITDPDTGIMTLYNDAGVPLLTAPIKEDAAGTQDYRGDGAERRERLT